MSAGCWCATWSSAQAVSDGFWSLRTASASRGCFAFLRRAASSLRAAVNCSSGNAYSSAAASAGAAGEAASATAADAAGHASLTPVHLEVAFGADRDVCRDVRQREPARLAHLLRVDADVAAHVARRVRNADGERLVAILEAVEGVRAGQH